MNDLNGFDASMHEPIVGFQPVPAGRYAAQLVRSEFKPTKVGTGKYLELEFEISSGEYRGRLVWARLNLDNPSPTAVKMAQQELSAICRAVGVLRPQSTSDLEHRPLTITVVVKSRSDGGGLTNEIRAYERASGATDGEVIPV
ncbi:MAG: DUF669 domain-containing protein [Phycisphaerales bacterium]|nr:DUF669 domain-containing protein [Phycisphaerales bacterium]